MKISDRVDGAIVAPAIPIKARLAMSMSAVDENAAASDATAKPAAPASKSFRRPMRSPRVPMVMSRPATRKP